MIGIFNINLNIIIIYNNKNVKLFSKRFKNNIKLLKLVKKLIKLILVLVYFNNFIIKSKKTITKFEILDLNFYIN